MRVINEIETRNVLSVHRAAEIIDATYRAAGEGSVHASVPSVIRIGSTPHRLGAKGAVLDSEGIAGVRLTSRAAPRLMLWSLVSGEPIALLDESYLYRFRTGVSAAVVARYLLPAQRVRRAAIIGAGPIAKQAAIAIHQLLDPEEIVVAARRPAAVEEFATTAGALGTPVHAALDIDAATDGADLLVTITSAKEELILPRHVGHTATILSMGGGPEVSHDVWQAAATRFVDDLDYALHQGDAAAWIASGAATRQSFEASLTGTVGDLAAGRRHGDAAAEGLRMAIIQGMTALDVALAYAVYQAVASKKKD